MSCHFLIISTALLFSVIFSSFLVATTESLEEAQGYYKERSRWWVYLYVSTILCSLATFSQYCLVRSNDFRRWAHTGGRKRIITLSYSLFILLLISSGLLFFVIWRWGMKAESYPSPLSYGITPMAFQSYVVRHIKSLIIPVVLSFVGTILSLSQCLLLKRKA